MTLLISPLVWHGRRDTDEGPLAKFWHQEVQLFYPKSPQQSSVPGIVLQGFACDEGVRRNQGRVGAKQGPTALRQALANLAWHGGLPVYDAGDVVCDDDDLEDAQRQLAQRVAKALEDGHISFVLGGGHETAYGHWLGLKHAFPNKHIGIVNLDAHFDLRRPMQEDATGKQRGTSGTPFAQIAADCQLRQQPFSYLCLGIAEPSNTQALFQTAKDLGVQWRLDRETTWEHRQGLVEQISAFVAGVDVIYLTIDLDVLPAGQMPAVSAPAAYGVDVRVIEMVAIHLAQSGKVIAADVVELNPAYDVDHHGARVAARIVWALTKNLRPVLF